MKGSFFHYRLIDKHIDFTLRDQLNHRSESCYSTCKNSFIMSSAALEELCQSIIVNYLGLCVTNRGCKGLKMWAFPRRKDAIELHYGEL